MPALATGKLGRLLAASVVAVWVQFVALPMAVAVLSEASRSQPLLARPPAQVERYALALLNRYDANGDGLLQADEWHLMRGSPQQIDRDGDALLTRGEIGRHVADFAQGKHLAPPRAEPRRGMRPPAPAAGAMPHDQSPVPTKPYYVPQRFLPQGLPEWFLSRDANGDAQLSLFEYSPTGEAQLANQFQRLDANRDGLITPQEAIQEPGLPARDAASSPASPVAE